MDLVSFQKNFKNIEIDLKKYIAVVSILIVLLLGILLFNNNIEDYYVGISKISNKKIEVLTTIDNLKNITENNQIIIERNTFTYEIEKVEDYLYENTYYKKIIINIKDMKENKLIDNTIVKYEIVTNKTTIFEYLIKTLKGDE
ncbi:MAG: hypothetical protein IKO78_06135 [Bacilli bacterium]|nr:hypothetical protein [Bacilli bacterium]